VSEPRLSASVLLIRDEPFEVLMMERHAAAVFGSALVFPGGCVEAEDGADLWRDLIDDPEDLPDDERILRIAVCRELFEETGLLLLDRPFPHDPDVGVGADFHSLVARSGGRLALGGLYPFGHWITPLDLPKRFDTHFYLAKAPAGQVPRCDGHEAVRLAWLQPAAVMAQADAGQCKLLLPTRMNLLRLDEHETCDRALAASHLYPRVPVLPQPERTERGRCIRIAAEAGYALTEVWLNEQA